MIAHPHRILQFALLILLNLLASNPLLAWSMGGHRVTAVIAAREITMRSPHTAEKLITIMRAHPAAGMFEARLDDTGTEPQARLERLFAEIAQWPDEVRGGPFKAYHRGNWHTYGLPFAVDGFVSAISNPIPEENMLWALRENTRIAGDPAAAPADRAVALCWVFHLVGDLHQPLHTASLYSTEFPDGDRYGAQAWVLQPHGGEAVSLHYFWDSAVQRSQSMPEVTKTATELRLAHPHGSLDEMRIRPYRGADSYGQWTLEESHRLAISAVYREGRLSGATTKKNARRLDEDYVASARALAARRMALSGHRLAEALRHILQ